MSKLLKLKKQGSTLGKVNQDVNLLASEVQSTTHQFNIDNQNSVAKLSDYLIKSCPFFGHIKTSTSIAACLFHLTFYKGSPSKGTKQRSLLLNQRKTKHFIVKLFAPPFTLLHTFSILGTMSLSNPPLRL